MGGTTSPIIEYRAGAGFAIALRKDGTVSYAGTAPGTLGAAITGGTLTGIRGIAAGKSHALFIMSDGTVAAYGDPITATQQALDVPVGLANVVAVAAGKTQSYALDSGGTLVAWGANGSRLAVQLANNRTGIKQFVAADDLALALQTDGTPIAFDANESNISFPGTLGAVKSVATDGYNYYALKADGSTASWGNANAAKAAFVVTGAATIAGGPHALVALSYQGGIRLYGYQDGPSAAPRFVDDLLKSSRDGNIRGFSNLALSDDILVATRCPETCGSISGTGCCDAGTLLTCSSTTGATSSTACGSGCGWTSAGYACTATPASAPPVPVADCKPKCEPQCSGKTCGPDGCGGICGTCTGLDTCNASGVCSCVKQCAASNGCGDDGCGGVCGTCSANGYCGTSPSGFFRTCVCVPDCAGKNCGSDGCGGLCGECNGFDVCGADGVCACSVTNSCAAQGRVCGPDGACGGSCGQCPGTSVCTAQGKCQCTPDCTGKECGGPGADGCGGTCPRIDGVAVNPDNYCKSTLTTANPALSQGNITCNTTTFACLCTATCLVGGKLSECGSDGCGGSCGACQSPATCLTDVSGAKVCQCVPSCSGKSCGPDGCGGTCTNTCGAYDGCDQVSGQCIACVANCSGKKCGPDGCGGQCANLCAQGETCNTGAGTCFACVPSCARKGCGADDGCGGKCGVCKPGEYCYQYKDVFGDIGTLCRCKPSCDGKTCGPDGCGGYCGACGIGSTCNDATGQCGCVPSCLNLPGAEDLCGSDGCGGTCGAGCGAGQACGTTKITVANGSVLDRRVCIGVCTPQCDGKTCGPDGCGGQCGLCGTNEACGSDGTCRRNACPDIPKEGCCDGDTARYCAYNSATKSYGEVKESCKLDSKYCSWSEKRSTGFAADAGYACVAAPAQTPAGRPLRACPGAVACQPKCGSKTCGSDGCGGTCGTCATGNICNMQLGLCTPNVCGLLPNLFSNPSCCLPDAAVVCDKSGAPTITACSGGKQCMWQATGSAQPPFKVAACRDPENAYAQADAAKWGVTPTACPNTFPCLPKCGGKTCGDDGCGGSCGSCSSGEVCSPIGQVLGNASSYTLIGPNNCCTPKCTVGTCGGPDGCGGTCPDETCGPGKYCNRYVPYAFEPHCVVGTDACKAAGVTAQGCCGGGVRTFCDATGVVKTETCSGACVWYPGEKRYLCADADENLDDGDYLMSDPSGKSPRYCAGATCTPNCAGRDCGDDGCGGSCGTCSKDQACAVSTGKCLGPVNATYPMRGCCHGDTLRRSRIVKGVVEQSEQPCQGCGWNAGVSRYTCYVQGLSDPSGTYPRICPCVPQCFDRNCGDDGCGGSCGTCPSDQRCRAYTGTCYVADCADKPCGPDQFGTSCGKCSDSTICSSEFQCIPKPTCQAISWQGACLGEGLYFCSGKDVVQEDCNAKGQQRCGWNPTLQAYSCGTDGGGDPSGTNPKAYPGTKAAAAGCAPKCKDSCGSPDGCGGLCGAPCGWNSKFDSNACVTPYVGSSSPECVERPLTATWEAENSWCNQLGAVQSTWDPKTKSCRPQNWGSCKPPKVLKMTAFRSYDLTVIYQEDNSRSRCGENHETWAGWTCQCDTGCIERGDCCADFVEQCRVGCSDGECTGQETCSSCPSDCVCPSGGAAPPWASPNAAQVTAQGRAITVAADVDALSAADTLVSRELLVAYVPGPGTIWGLAARSGYVEAGTLKAGGTYTTVPGVQGQALRFGNASQSAPSNGVARVVLPARFPRATPGQSDWNDGGYTVALWVRVPSTAPAASLPLAWLTAPDKTGEVRCLAARPSDESVGLSCTTPGTTVQRVSVFYGEAIHPHTPGAIACYDVEAAHANASCAADVNPAVRAACTGKASCVVVLPPKPACLGAAVPEVLVRYECGLGAIHGLSLGVAAPSDGGGLTFGPGTASDLRTSTSVRDGLWHHVAITFAAFLPGSATPDVGVTSMYVDGALSAQSDAKLISFDCAKAGTYGCGFFDELVLGGSETTGGVGDIDEVFVYGRTLNPDQVARLRTKRDAGLLRVWPPIRAVDAAGTGTGVLKFTPTTEVRLDPRVLQRAGWLGLVPLTTYTFAQPDGDLSSLSNFTLAGWVRLTTAAMGTLFELFDGEASQVALSRAAACGGLGLQGKVASGAPLVASSCAHGLANDTWQFMALVRDGQKLSLWLDGALLGETAAGSATALFTGAGDRRFATGPGVSLGWAGLFGRALSPSELERFRRPGPVAWLDGGTWNDGGTLRPRDLAGYANVTGAATVQSAELRTSSGGAPTGPGQVAGPLTLGGGAAASELLIPAQGRTGATAATGIRPFSWMASVRVGDSPPPGGIPLVMHATAAQGTWTPRLTLDLRCSRVGTALTCSLQLVGQRADGSFMQWQSAKRTASAPATGAVSVDVALAWDGVSPRWTLGSPDVAFDLGGPEGIPAAATEGLPSFMLESVSAPAAAPTTVPAAGGVTGSWFRVAATAGSGPLALSQVRLYNRSLADMDLVATVRRSCAAAACATRGQVCLSGGAPSTAICGGCAPGNYAVGLDVPSVCRQKGEWGDSCQLNEQCVDGQTYAGVTFGDCLNGVCRSQWQTVKCRDYCLQFGRQCNNESCGGCLPYHEANASTGVCSWKPPIGANGRCTTGNDISCVSGVCGANSRCAAATPAECLSLHRTYTATPKASWTYKDHPEQAPVGDVRYECGGCSLETYTGADGKAAPLYVQRKKLITKEACKLIAANAQQQVEDHCPKKCSNIADGFRLVWTTSGQTFEWNMVPNPDPTKACYYNGTCHDPKPHYPREYSLVEWGEAEDLRRGWAVPATLSNLAQFVVNAAPGSSVTPKNIADMINLGVGPDLIEYATSKAFRTAWRAGLPKWNDFSDSDFVDVNGEAWLNLAKCETAMTREIVNDDICAPNQFPDGTVCPPPGTDPALADSFCSSGFCARDTHRCEEGYGRLERTNGANRRDEGKGESSAGTLDLAQNNVTTFELKKVKNPGEPDTAPQNPTSTISARVANTLRFFGASIDIMALDASITTVNSDDEEEKSATYSATVSLFGISQPKPPEPPLACSGSSWKNGELEPGSAKCEPKKLEAGLSNLIPALKVCTPAPGGCKEDPNLKGTLPATKKKEKGPLCRKATWMVGPIPVTIEAGVVLEACFGYGVSIDPESYEAAFKIEPGINVGLEIKGGVGGGIGPIIEAFAGVKAAVTIVELKFPIIWAFQLIELTKDELGNAVENMWRTEFTRTVKAEMTVMKVAISAFAELTVAVFLKLEWEYELFSLGGFTFEWELSKSMLESKKIDLQNKTASP